jgi:hypothetical protein
MGEAFALKRGVYFASVDEDAILMDLDANKYFALSKVSADIWKALEQRKDLGTAAADVGERLAISQPTASALVQKQIDIWKSMGLVVNAHAHEVRCRPWDAAAPKCLRNLERPNQRLPLIRLLFMIARIVSNALQVRLKVKKCGLGSALSCIQKKGDRPEDMDARRAFENILLALSAQVLLRLPLLQGRSDCLWRSMTLAATLRSIGVDARLCLGVSKYPFRAHAWVEALDYIVNDNTEHVSAFTRIARI